MAKIVVLGKELPGDFFDADFADIYETATKSMAEAVASRKKGEYTSLGASMRAQCETVRDYFDAIFGDGTSEALFGEAYNLKVHIQAVAELTEAAGVFKKEMNDLTNKYTQRQNAYRGKR